MFVCYIYSLFLLLLFFLFFILRLTSQVVKENPSFEKNYSVRPGYFNYLYNNAKLVQIYMYMFAI